MFVLFCFAYPCFALLCIALHCIAIARNFVTKWSFIFLGNREGKNIYLEITTRMEAGAQPYFVDLWVNTAVIF